MEGYVPPHFAGPLFDYFTACGVNVIEPKRNILRVPTSFGNYLEFEVSPHMLAHTNRIVVRYCVPKTHRIQHIQNHYVRVGSANEAQAFHECVNCILAMQERDALLWNFVMRRVTTLFYVLRTCKSGSCCINKDVRKQIVTLFQKMLIRSIFADAILIQLPKDFISNPAQMQWVEKSTPPHRAAWALANVEEPTKK